MVDGAVFLQSFHSVDELWGPRLLSEHKVPAELHEGLLIVRVIGSAVGLMLGDGILQPTGQIRASSAELGCEPAFSSATS